MKGSVLRVSVKLGGFLFGEDLNMQLLKAYAGEIRKLSSDGYKLVIVTGGGETARRYVKASKDLGVSEALCDELGIQVSRFNSLLLIASLWEIAYRRVPSTIEEAIAEVKEGLPVVMGGSQPGQSTNAVAALAAELMGADILVNLTDVRGVYARDPKLERDVKVLETITVKKLEEIISEKSFAAGRYELLDPLALKVIERSKIRTIITSGLDPKNLTKAIRGEKIGTKIIFEEEKDLG